MSEEKKEGSCCSPAKSCGCGCGSGFKLLAGLLIGAFIFAAGMWFANSHCPACHGWGGGHYCPISDPASK